jgi:hypothetical protein
MLKILYDIEKKDMSDLISNLFNLVVDDVLKVDIKFFPNFGP